MVRTRQQSQVESDAQRGSRDNLIYLQWPHVEMRTHHQSSIESDSQIRGTETIWLAYNVRAWKRVHTSTVQSRPMSLDETSLNAACFHFTISQLPVIGRDVWYFALRNNFRKVNYFSYGPPGNLRCLSS